MNEFKIITGFYPSEETALKVLGKVKARTNKAYILRKPLCYAVVISSCLTLGEARNEADKFNRLGVACGVMVD